jgi:hypothetical protein
MKHWNVFVKRIVRDHHTIGFTGIMLIGMGLISFFENFFENILGLDFNFSHGLLFMGVFNVLLAVAFIIMGTASLEASIEKTVEADPISKKIDELQKEIEILQKEIQILKQ